MEKKFRVELVSASEKLKINESLDESDEIRTSFIFKLRCAVPIKASTKLGIQFMQIDQTIFKEIRLYTFMLPSVLIFLIK